MMSHSGLDIRGQSGYTQRVIFSLTTMTDSEQCCPGGICSIHNRYRDVLPTGAVLDGIYRVQQVIGRGESSVTYLADLIEQNESDEPHAARHVAIKEFFVRAASGRLEDGSISPAEGQQQELDNRRGQFLLMATQFTGLKHPNIAGALHVFEENGTAYYAMPFANGMSMRHYPAPIDRADASRLETLLFTLLSALSAMQAKGTHHEAIKPENILLTKAGAPVLVDYERAFWKSPVGEPGTVTPDGYTAPELVNRSRAASHSSDIYALGATFYRLITGEEPTASPAPLSTNRKLQHLYAPNFLASIDKAMHPVIKKRWRQAADWQDFLTPGRKKRAHIWPWILLLLLAAAAVTAYCLWGC